MSICSIAAPDPRKRVILALTDEGVRPIFVPVLKAFKALGIGSTQGWGLVKQGKIKTVVRNGRRLAVVESIEELAEEWLADETTQEPRKGLTYAPSRRITNATTSVVPVPDKQRRPTRGRRRHFRDRVG